MTDHILLCDFSFGSYMKLALGVPGRRPSDATLYSYHSKKDFDEAVVDFLAAHDRPALIGAALSSRGWERRGAIQLPEKGLLSLSRDDVRHLLSIQRVNLVNNFVARALAIPRLRESESVKLCGNEPLGEQVIAVLGPHHGLGLAALAPDGAGNWAAIPCEGGHSDLPITNDREWQVYRVLKAKHGHVAREFVISMAGLVELFQALNVIDHGESHANTPEEVIALANIGDPVASEAIAMCTGWLAAMASDVALMLGARGGIYLTGDLMDLLGDLFDPNAFCKRYIEKGRLSDFVSDIPVYQTRTRDLEIIGLSTLFD